jgi:conjugative relaxase-like TrwC/TraI family protein
MVRFDKPCCALGGAVEYFREHLRVGDYLTEEGRVAMEWRGQGAALLGLEGECDLGTFKDLCEGRHPWSGERLGVRQKAGRRLCYFGQISAPKDVSIAYLVGGDTRIAGWWEEAVEETLHEIEASVATRVRAKGANSDRITGNMVAAIVTHDASRALDPQLHTHVCIMNQTFDAVEKRWKGVQPSGFFRHPGYFREVCYNRLAARMLDGGYEIEPARKVGFQIVGLPDQLRTRFSKRREEIMRLAQEAGVTSQAELQAITAKSRAAKTQATAADLREAWLKEAGHLIEPLSEVIARSRSRTRSFVPCFAEATIVSAEAQVFERRSVVDRRVLLREALAGGRGKVALSELKRELAQRAHEGRLMMHGDLVGSPEALADEKEFLSWAEGQGDVCRALGSPGDVSKLGGTARVVTGILSSPSRVIILQGDAGTGKTTCLRSILEGVEADGGRVFGCAPTSGATEVLRSELTPAAETIQQLLVNTPLQESVRGHVIVVDEAGLLSSRQMRDLCRMAEANNNRLLLVGDTKQHSSVEAGDALRCLKEYANVPVFHLTKIRRQKDRAYRDAVALLAAGKARAGFDAFDRLGAVTEILDTRQLMRRAAEDYVQTRASGKSCLAISPVWSEIHEFGKEVRKQLRSAGKLIGPETMVQSVHSLQWTGEERRRVETYQPGDLLSFRRPTQGFEAGEHAVVVRKEVSSLVLRRDDGSESRFDPQIGDAFDVGVSRDLPIAGGDQLLIRANHRNAKLRNGDLVEVSGVESDGQIRLKDGRAIPTEFRQFTHGYATTSHAAQGKTVQRGLLIMADAGIASANLKQAYVSNSRFVESQMIYTTDRMAARDAMTKSGDRMLAVELKLIQGEANSARRSFLAEAYAQGTPSGLDLLRGSMEERTGPALTTGTAA